METGIKGLVEFTVGDEHTAEHAGSGTLRVLATPVMISMIEKAAWASVSGFLDEGQGTVGTRIDISHDAATPVGMKVRCETELISVEGRKLTFSVEAFDECGHIGGGTHERFIVTNDKFQNKTDSKLNKT